MSFIELLAQMTSHVGPPSVTHRSLRQSASWSNSHSCAFLKRHRWGRP